MNDLSSKFTACDDLADKLRCVDIAFDSIKRAQRIYKRLHPEWRPSFRDEAPSEHSRRINAIRQRLQYKTLCREGLPIPAELILAVRAPRRAA